MNHGDKLYLSCQWPFQDPKLEVPTIYKAYVSGLCKGISQQNMALYGTSWWIHPVDSGGPSRFPRFLKVCKPLQWLYLVNFHPQLKWWKSHDPMKSHENPWNPIKHHLVTWKPQAGSNVLRNSWPKCGQTWSKPCAKSHEELHGNVQPSFGHHGSNVSHCSVPLVTVLVPSGHRSRSHCFLIWQP